MKYILKTISIITLACFIISVSVFTGNAQENSVKLSAVCENGMVGDTIVAYVNIDNASLGSVSANINYDNTELQFISATVSTAGCTLPYNSANLIESSSQVRYTGVTSDIVDVNVNGSLMEVKFKILKSSGEINLDLSGTAYSATGNKLNVSTVSGKITVKNTEIVIGSFTSNDICKEYKNDSNSVVVKNCNGNILIGTQKAGTGSTITINNNIVIPIIMLADTDGDGEITSLDYSIVKRASVDICDLTGSFLTAADLNGDGVIDGFDTALLDLELNK